MPEKQEIKHADGTVLGHLTPGYFAGSDMTVWVRPVLDVADGAHAVLTGSAAGVVRLTDGSLYDLSPDTIPVKAEHSGAVWHHCETQIAYRTGQPHACSDLCGAERTS